MLIGIGAIAPTVPPLPSCYSQDLHDCINATTLEQAQASPIENCPDLWRFADVADNSVWERLPYCNELRIPWLAIAGGLGAGLIVGVFAARAIS